MKSWLGGMVILLAVASVAQAEVVTQVVEYRHGEVVLEGVLGYDAAGTGKRPGVLVIHDWTGVGAYVKKRVEQLAALGYVAFAADIYGKGVRPVSPEDCAREMGRYKNDRALLRARAAAALERLAADERVDRSRLAAIGYCFGGMAALELARSGAEVRAVVSFHGALDAARGDEGARIKAKVLVCHGADDRFIKDADIAAFQQEMRDGKVDWQMISYGGAVHSFTNPAAGNDPTKGVAYHADADRRSWAAMLGWFEEVFGTTAVTK